MKQLLKQFTAWDIGLKTDVFKAARLRLTFYYILVMAVIIGVFSVVLYVSIARNIEENIGEENISEKEIQVQTIVNTTDDIKMSIFLIDGVLLILIGSLSYFLAGITLKPIVNALESQKRFTADASHDLRTPLAIMQTDIEVTLADKKHDYNQMRKTLNSNLEEVHRMSNLVADLLMVARLENPMLESLFSKFDLTPLVSGITEKFRSQIKAKLIKLDFIKNTNGTIRGVKADLERAIFNVLQNALKYTSEGGAINLSITEDRQYVYLAIVDTGIGISEIDLPFVFERFYKASNSRHDSSVGSGLGLSIARELLRANKGEIRIESKLGSGTKVIMLLPKV